MRVRTISATALLAAGALALAGCASGSVGESKPATSATDTASDTPASDTAPDNTSSDGSTTDGSATDGAGSDDVVANAKALVEASVKATEGFTPPTGGPTAQAPGAKIVYVASDLTNGGINAVAQGVQEAAEVIGWTVDVLDGQASAQGRTVALSQAIALQPDGIILGGFDATEQASMIKQATESGIPVVAWHAGSAVGPMDDVGVFANVTTDPIEVSKLAAAYIIADSNGQAGVQIFTDSQYQIAVDKADAIKEAIEACSTCTVLSYDDSPIAEASSRMPTIIASSLQQYGDQLTYLIGINGAYCTGAAPALQSAGVPGDGPPQCVAAGDGDAAELQRIRTVQFQSATVAEPVILQGWQLVDELNRAIAGEAWSGFVAAPGVITVDNVPDGDLFDPDSGYREIYKSNWGK